jgi:hypothetical protein
VSIQSIPHAKIPIYVSQKSPHPRFPTVFQRPGIKVVPTINHVTEDTIVLENGDILTDIDTIVFATGYYYTYPFLSEKIRPQSNGAYVPGLYQHIFDTYNPQSIGFVGIATATLAWVTWEKSAFLLALLWSGRINLPSIESQRNWEVVKLSDKGQRHFHYLTTMAERVLYWDELNELAAEYLHTKSLDDALLDSFPFEFVLSLIAGHPVKEKFYEVGNYS